MRHSRRKNAEVRPTERWWNAKALSVGNYHVGAICAGWPEQAKRNWIGRDDEQSTNTVHHLGKAFDRLALTEEVGVLDDQRGSIFIKQAFEPLELSRAILVTKNGRCMRPA